MKKKFQIHFVIMMVIAGFLSLGVQQSGAAPVYAASVPAGTAKSYQLVILNGDASLSTYIANAQEEFAISYPQLVTRWAANPNTAPDVINLQFVKNLGAAAEAFPSQKLIKVDLDYAHANPYDPGVLTHELTHVMQNYSIDGGWLTEAIANYSSQLYGPRRED